MDTSTLIGLIVALTPIVIQVIRLLQAVINSKANENVAMVTDFAFDKLIDITQHITGVMAEEAKKMSPTGKITPEQEKILHSKAIEELETHGKEAGIDFVKTIGVKALSLLIKKAVVINKVDNLLTTAKDIVK